VNIADQKREILGLIAKLHRPADASRQLPAGTRDSRLAVAHLQDRIARRQRDLAAITDRRERTAADLLEERLLKICRDLDMRISRIEAILNEQSRSISPSAAAADSQVAVDLSDLTPDLGIPGAARREQLPAGRRQSEASLGGVINRATLPDILQMISSNAMNGIFVLEGAGKTISLYMQEGEMFHAVTDGLEGQSAFFAAMALEEGRFHFYETDDLPEEKTIDGNTQFLILEALRQIDEDQQGGG
jgi:hypothetical protein